MDKTYMAVQIAAKHMADMIPDDEGGRETKVDCLIAGITLGLALADADMFFFERWVNSVYGEEANELSEEEVTGGRAGLENIKKIAMEVASVR